MIHGSKLGILHTVPSFPSIFFTFFSTGKRVFFAAHSQTKVKVLSESQNRFYLSMQIYRYLTANNTSASTFAG
jgi:hypothetical protein